MAEPRDRLARPVDVAALFVHRRSAGVWLDQPAFESPVRQWPAEAMGTPIRSVAARGGGIRSGRLGSSATATGRSRNLYGSAVRRHTTPAGSFRRPTNRSGVVPSWYPRTPLRDITSIAMTIERRRAQLRETDGQDVAPEGQRLDDSCVMRSSALLEHSCSLMSPIPTVGVKHSAGSAGERPILFVDDSEFVTPQKKLLNSIDMVEKVVKEELQKLKRSPTAKRAEREKRVHTLLSMR